MVQDGAGKQSSMPIELMINLTTHYDIKRIAATLYSQLVGSRIYLTYSHLDIFFYVVILVSHS
jgi:hypothetical protein